MDLSSLCVYMECMGIGRQALYFFRLDKVMTQVFLQHFFQNRVKSESAYFLKLDAMQEA